MHRAALVLALVATTAPAAASPATPVPGTVGLVVREVTLRNACSPTFAQITVRKRGDDPKLVKALTWPRIGGLDLDPAHEARARAGRKKFDTWFRDMTAAYRAAADVQRAIIGDSTAAPLARVEAAARTALLTHQMAITLGASDLPKNLRAIPEAVTMYCDTLDEHVAPLEDEAAQARAACAKFAADANLAAGWWSAVCTAP